MGRRDTALSVWFAARAAAGAEPDAPRVARVGDKLADPGALLVLVERSGETVGMALAEPFREQDGTAEVRPGWGHVSMVFVHPAYRGTGVGTELVHRLVGEGPWPHLSVWTRRTNVRAQRLYEGCGFVVTDDVGSLGGGEATQRWERVGPDRG